MRVESHVFPPFIAKRVEGIFGYDILLYGLFSVDNEEILHKVLHDSMCCGVQAPIYTRQTRKKNIFMFRTHFDIFIIQAYTTI